MAILPMKSENAQPPWRHAAPFNAPRPRPRERDRTIPFSRIVSQVCQAGHMIPRVLLTCALLTVPTLKNAQTNAIQANRFPTIDKLPVVEELPNPFVFLDGTPATGDDRHRAALPVRPRAEAAGARFNQGGDSAALHVAGAVTGLRAWCFLWRSFPEPRSSRRVSPVPDGRGNSSRLVFQLHSRRKVVAHVPLFR